ncbi:MAG: serine/threonine-protein kinase [Gemmatimonadales bacterium]
MSASESDLERRLRAALAGRFDVGAEVARGSMARVYRATRAGDPTPLALKLLPPELASAGNAERFLREIEIIAGLRHPSILSIVESGEDDGLLWYAMPFVAGSTVRELLQREGLPSLDDTLAIARQVLEGLGYAHQQGVVHRDLKPENVMVTGPTALVMDFGLARTMASTIRLTGAGMPLGTPAYMSPEQITGADQVDGRSDLYGFACVLYEMLTGRPPFVATGVVALLRAHLQEPPLPPSQHRSKVPANVDRAIQRALAKAPEARPATAEVMLAELLEGVDPSRLERGAGPRPSRPLEMLKRIFGKR